MIPVMYGHLMRIPGGFKQLGRNKLKRMKAEEKLQKKLDKERRKADKK